MVRERLYLGKEDQSAIREQHVRVRVNMQTDTKTNLIECCLPDTDNDIAGSVAGRTAGEEFGRRTYMKKQK